MSTTTPDYNAIFQTDFNTMKAQAAAVQASIAQSADDYQNYQDKLKNLNISATEALMLLFYIMGASSQSSTALGSVTEWSGTTGDRLALNGSVTKVSNDLNNMTNSNVVNGVDGKNLMLTFVNDANEFLDTLSSTDPNNPMNPNLPNPSMDPTAEGSVYNELLQIRQLFKTGSEHDPSGSDIYYFDPTGAGGKITDFAEFQTDLGLQGDVQGSTDAAKIITDNFGTNTQTTQTASAVLNNDEKTYTSLQQTVQSFLASIAQWWNGIVKGTNSHMASAS